MEPATFATASRACDGPEGKQTLRQADAVNGTWTKGVISPLVAEALLQRMLDRIGRNFFAKGPAVAFLRL